MARPTTLREIKTQVVVSDPPAGQEYERLEYMTAPDGMFSTITPQSAGPNQSIIAKNLLINDNGKFQIRRPMDRKFYDAAITPIGMIGVSDPTGTGTLFLFHNTGVKFSVNGGI